MIKNKIIKINELTKKLSIVNKKIGLCHGVFDLLHLGHINHFNEAKKNCDILISKICKLYFFSMYNFWMLLTFVLTRR